MTATEDHSAALSKLREALEVEEAATPGPWTHSDVLRGHAYHRGHDVIVGRPQDIDAAILARALLRPALLNAVATLEQHRPKQLVCDDGPACAGECIVCAECGTDFSWDECPDAQRALALAAHIPEGGAR